VCGVARPGQLQITPSLTAYVATLRRNAGVRRASIVKTRADIIAGRDTVLDTAIHSLQTTH
jgi:hypothetical protein